ncbi:DNA-processing protein DprA [Microbacterium sp. LMI1-1-1.1]|uniref:DNA-processing protein DprA n=1 Tax=Microbacterium sp. LMI1-1-1.1 TaxID=3135223 RepID=UPI003466624F
MSAPGQADGVAVGRLVESVRAGEPTADVRARVVWSVLVEPGDGVAGALIAAYGPAEALRRAVTGENEELAVARRRWLPRLRHDTAEAALDSARRAGVRLVLPGDPDWPARFDDLGAHAPVALWTRGRVGWADPPTVALVGARAATAYGEGVAADLAAELAADGVVIVSGAAYGIDGAAHRAALSAGGTTIALLAGGVDRAYPRGHEGLLARVSASGAVWSEIPCGAAPTKWRFLARNRLIAALADAVVVVEAGWRSGSLNTAAHAAELGRSLGAVPGPVTSAASAGCHRILREFSGVCVTSSEDVREMIGLSDPATHAAVSPTADTGRTDDRTRVLDALSSRTGRSTAEVARRCGIDPDRTLALLGLAELREEAQRDEDGTWRRSGGR